MAFTEEHSSPVRLFSSWPEGTFKKTAVKNAISICVGCVGQAQACALAAVEHPEVHAFYARAPKAVGSCAAACLLRAACAGEQRSIRSL